MTGSPPAERSRAAGKPLWIIDLGRQAYEETQSLQTRLVQARMERKIPDVLLLLEHPPVFTLGRQGRWTNVLLSRESLKARGMDCVATERGGDVTYHGPGQLVGYPIVRVPGEGRKVKTLVRAFEEVLLRTLARFGACGRRVPGNPGVWVGESKIASIGIAVRHGISFHGFSLNTDMDLTPFSWIRPCGLPGLSMTSLSEVLGKNVSLCEVKGTVASVFAETLDYRPCLPEDARIGAARALGLPDPGERPGDGPGGEPGRFRTGTSPQGSGTG